jgi:hypothetical protein
MDGSPKSEGASQGDTTDGRETNWFSVVQQGAMTHIAIQEKLDVKAVDWMEKVSDAQYQA